MERGKKGDTEEGVLMEPSPSNCIMLEAGAVGHPGRCSRDPAALLHCHLLLIMQTWHCLGALLSSV